MAALQHCAAPAAGLAAPESALSDEARELGSSDAGFRGQITDDSGDCAAVPLDKIIATAVARAALFGIEARTFADGAWLLRHANGAAIGIVRGVGALTAAVGGFEAARDDVQALLNRMRGAA